MIARPTPADPNALCPCESGLAYARCCGPLHEGTRVAATAEALMRSRYSAYVLDRLDYLRETWAAETRPAAIAPNEAGLRWLGLQVRRHQTLGPDRAVVEFVARYRIAGRAHRLEELSEFARREGRWYYLRALPGPDQPRR